MKSLRFALFIAASFAILQARGVAAEPAQQKQVPRYSMQFTLTCANGPCAHVYYTICYPSGIAAIGETDDKGRTTRYRTQEPEKLRVFMGHREAGDCSKDADDMSLHVTPEKTRIN